MYIMYTNNLIFLKYSSDSFYVDSSVNKANIKLQVLRG
jgi:hypothetical protein